MRHRIKIQNFWNILRYLETFWRYLENFWRYLEVFSRISRKIFRPNLGTFISEPTCSTSLCNLLSNGKLQSRLLKKLDYLLIFARLQSHLPQRATCLVVQLAMFCCLECYTASFKETLPLVT